MKLTNLAIKNSTTVYILIFIFFVIGLYSYRTLPREAAPDVKIPILIVTTPYIGVSGADIETLITIPIEKKLKELSNVKSMNSTSAEGASMVTVEFDPSVDLDEALQKVRDKVDLAKPDIPKEAEDPIIIEVNLSEFPIMFVNIAGQGGLVKLKEIGEDLQDEIEQVQGVLDVNLVGGLEREIKVIVDANRLQEYGLSFNAVINTLQAENVNIPGGSMEIGNLKYLVRIPGEFTSMLEIENIVLKSPGGRPIYLRDVAQVVDGYKDRETYARFDGVETISVSVQKRIGENILEISDAVKALVKKYEARYPGIEFAVTSDNSQFVRDIVKDLENNMITGLVLVMIILFFSMGFINASFVSVAVPFAMLISFAVIKGMGVTLNFMVLFSLIVALGMLVDNSIVIVESIYRFMQEGMDRVSASKRAAAELGVPMITSTLTTLSAFFPLLFWPGTTGDFIYYLPLVLIISLSASLFIAIVINPVFAATFMRKPKGPLREEGDISGNKFLQMYRAALSVALRFRWVTVAITVVLFVVSFPVFGKFNPGVSFFSDSDPAVASIEVRLPEGTKVEVTNEITKKVEAMAEKYRKDLDSLQASVGSPGQGEGGSMGGGGGSYSHIGNVTLDFVDLNKRSRSTKDILEELRAEVKTLTGAAFKISEQSQGPPTGAPVSIDISGDDFAELGRLRQEIKNKIEKIPGLVDLRDNFNNGKPEIRVTVDRALASTSKLSTSQIANTVRTAINGTEASKYRELDDEYDIVVRLGKDQRSAIEDIGNLRIANGDDDQIPISSVASIETSGGLGSVRRKESKRTVTIEANVEGRFAGEVNADVAKVLAAMTLPAGYSYKFGGESEDQKEAGEFLGLAFGVAVMLIFLVMVAQFNSVLLPLIIMSTIVLSIMGVMYGHVLLQSPFSIVLSGIGVVTLAGVVVNNGIILIDYIQVLRAKGLDVREALLTAAVVRARPVLLTAGTTVLGLAPTAFGYGIDFYTFTFAKAGESSQLFISQAVTIMSGLTVSTILTLFVVPCLYSIVDSISNGLKSLGGKLLRWVRPKRRWAANGPMNTVSEPVEDADSVRQSRD
jgi:multidrug efflux pump